MFDVVVRYSRMGKGVFAGRHFKKGERILHIEGRVIETNEPARLSKDVQDHLFPFGRRDGKNLYVYPQPPWKYLNHSCMPNAGIKNNRDIVAMRPIQKGEEILMDYAMNNIDDWRMVCTCGSGNCRKVIGTFGMLDEETKEKYREYVIDCLKT